MDNLSHVLAGLAAAEAIQRSLPAETDPAHQRKRHQLLLVGCALASSFPDLDLVLTPLLPAPIGYLLHHRGHTHTLLYALPQAMVLCALLWLLWPAARNLLQRSASARHGLALTMVAGFGLHLAMDYLNSYGLHPFHPFDSRWFYGDMVFIIEPVFWVALGVPLVMLIGRTWLRIGLLSALAATLAYFTAGGYMHWGSLLGLYLLGALLVLLRIGRTGATVSESGMTSLLVGVGAMALFLVAQATASAQAAQQLAAALAVKDPQSRLLDSARTAFPANPMCWNFVSVESNEAAGSYRLRRGVLSVAPELMPVAACPPVLAQRPLQHGSDPAISLLAQHDGSLAELRTLMVVNCHFEAWMRFARAPQIEGNVAADMRFASTPRGNFTAMDLSDLEGISCTGHVPRWEFPRADLLEPKPQ